jgi:hypothetical protein
VAGGEESEVRALVLASTSQGRLVRAAYVLHESARHAAELCDERVAQDPRATDAIDWRQRADHWRKTAQRALDVVTDWDATA